MGCNHTRSLQRDARPIRLNRDDKKQTSVHRQTAVCDPDEDAILGESPVISHRAVISPQHPEGSGTADYSQSLQTQMQRESDSETVRATGRSVRRDESWHGNRSCNLCGQKGNDKQKGTHSHGALLSLTGGYIHSL